MNHRQLRKLGIPDPCLQAAIEAIQVAAKKNRTHHKQIKSLFQRVLAAPESYADDDTFGPFAQAVIAHRDAPVPEAADMPASHYSTWGADQIDRATRLQMDQACQLPVARGAALMADAHVGYGLPIGGVLACENAVIPYAVGVDIACRMKMSVLDLSPDTISSRAGRYQDALESETRFGVGVGHERPQSHPVLDEDWSITRITREHKGRAWKQLGTSGSGNHFVEFGLLTFEQRQAQLDLEPGQYVALLSHSGSRGVGAAVCNTYSSMAQAQLPREWAAHSRLAWLELGSDAGQAYWQAMQLMGRYAAANHEVIHRLVTRHLGAHVVATIENHHNFAWKEIHHGREVIVHRKGATPAGQDELGIIPGSMATPAYVVRGKGNEASLKSAAHGAGRRMSRRQANDRYRIQAVQGDLKAKGVTVLSAGSDEVPAAYKDIDTVMSEQQDLVEVIGRFDPRIVKMCPGNSHPRKRRRVK